MGKSNTNGSNENGFSAFSKSFAKSFAVSYFTAKALNAAFDVDGKKQQEKDEREARKLEVRRRAELEKKAREEAQARKEEQARKEKEEQARREAQRKDKLWKDLQKEIEEKYDGNISAYMQDNFDMRGGFFN